MRIKKSFQIARSRGHVVELGRWDEVRSYCCCCRCCIYKEDSEKVLKIIWLSEILLTIEKSTIYKYKCFFVFLRYSSMFDGCFLFRCSMQIKATRTTHTHSNQPLQIDWIRCNWTDSNRNEASDLHSPISLRTTTTCSKIREIEREGKNENSISLVQLISLNLRNLLAFAFSD